MVQGRLFLFLARLTEGLWATQYVEPLRAPVDYNRLWARISASRSIPSILRTA